MKLVRECRVCESDVATLWRFEGDHARMLGCVACPVCGCYLEDERVGPVRSVDGTVEQLRCLRDVIEVVRGMPDGPVGLSTQMGDARRALTLAEETLEDELRNEERFPEDSQ